jgi:hypothetical protein
LPYYTLVADPNDAATNRAAHLDARKARLGDSDTAVLAKVLGHIDFGILASVLVCHGEGDIFGPLESDTHDGV